MPRLSTEEINKRYRKVNELYNEFSFLITQYNINRSLYDSEMSFTARQLILELKKFA